MEDIYHWDPVTGPRIAFQGTHRQHWSAHLHLPCVPCLVTACVCVTACVFASACVCATACVFAMVCVFVMACVFVVTCAMICLLNCLLHNAPCTPGTQCCELTRRHASLGALVVSSVLLTNTCSFPGSRALCTCEHTAYSCCLHTARQPQELVRLVFSALPLPRC